MIRELIVDGQPKVRRCLRMRLAIEPDMVVVGESGKAKEAPLLPQATRQRGLCQLPLAKRRLSVG